MRSLSCGTCFFRVGGYTVRMNSSLLAMLALLAFPTSARALDEANMKAMLRAARSYADADGRETKEPDAGLYLDIAAEQYRAGDAAGARETARFAQAIRREGDCPDSSQLTYLARAQWEAGGIAEASATMKAVLDAGIKADRKAKEECLLSLSKLKSDLGDMEGALATAALIPSARKTDLFPHIAEDFARQSRWSEAAAAADMAEPSKGNGAYYRAMDKSGGAASAVERALAGSADEALKLAKSSRGTDFYDWMRITSALAAHGRVADAIRTAFSKLSKNPDGHAAVLIKIANAQELSGDRLGAEKTLDQAMAISAKGQPEAHRTRGVLILAQRGQFDQIKGLGARLDDYSWAIKDLFEAGRTDAALALVKLAGMEFIDPVAGAQAVDAYVRKGDTAAALKNLEVIGRRIYHYDELLRDIAVEQMSQGDIAGALATASRLDTAFHTLKPLAIEAMAESQASTPVWASRLLRADEKARAWLGAARGMRLRREVSAKRRY